MPHASPSLMRAWTRIVKVQQHLSGAIARDLKAAGALPLDWYDALLELERAPHGHLSPGELEENMLIAQYSLSRLLDRLEKAGLIERLPHPVDGRRQVVAITEAGRARRAASWPIYAESVERHAGGRFDTENLQALLTLLARLLPETNEDHPPAGSR